MATGAAKETRGSRGWSIAASALRLVVVAGAVALPARLLWTERATAFGEREVAAAATAPEPGWAAVLLGGPSGAPARPLPTTEAPPRKPAGSAPNGPRRGDAAPTSPGERTGRHTGSDPGGAALGAPASSTADGDSQAGAAGATPFLPALREEQRARGPVLLSSTGGDPGGQPGGDPSGGASVPPRVPDDFELKVAPNTTLGEIARIYYGTARPSVVRALAAYNGLADPDLLRSGQTLFVPERSKLDLD